VALVPQHVITSGTAKDCVRLRGLPYEAQVNLDYEMNPQVLNRICLMV
jgi:hypothetical protein